MRGGCYDVAVNFAIFVGYCRCLGDGAAHGSNATTKPAMLLPAPDDADGYWRCQNAPSGIRASPSTSLITLVAPSVVVARNVSADSAMQVPSEVTTAPPAKGTVTQPAVRSRGYANHCKVAGDRRCCS